VSAEPASFAELEALLSARVDFERTPPKAGFELARVRALAAELGEPGAALPAVHVAGTTGKGTLTALVACATSLAGVETGWTTSPHLCHLRERIRVGAGPLSDAGWCAALGEVLAAEGRLGEAGSDHEPATFFELVILSALAAFRAADLDLSVVEVGLGGRLDATRAVHPSVCAITRIGLDHRELLGNDEASVAGEKAGILVEGVPLVAGPEHPAARAAIAERAEALGCPVWWEGTDLTVSGGRLTVPGRTLTLPDLSRNPARRSAAALAGGVLLRLEELWGRSDLLAALPAALERLRWRARCEWLEALPPILLDGAHDAPSAKALVAAYRARVSGGGGLLLALARGKDLEGIVGALSPLVERAWTCAAHASARAWDPGELAEALQAAGVPAEACPDLEAALERAREWSQLTGNPLLVAGSLYLAGAVLRALGQDADRAW
jgi:dihydrofolate synthase / folylpolyglutamate synthase